MIQDDALIEALFDAMGGGEHVRRRESAEKALDETPDQPEQQTTRDGLSANARHHEQRAGEIRAAAERMRPTLTALERTLGEYEGAPVGRVVRRQIVATFPRYCVAGPVGRRELVWTEALDVPRGAGAGAVDRVYLQYVYDAARDTIRTGMVEQEV